MHYTTQYNTEHPSRTPPQKEREEEEKRKGMEGDIR